MTTIPRQVMSKANVKFLIIGESASAVPSLRILTRLT